MATGGISVESFLGKISRDHLECAICADNYRDPKVLDCLHTFCLNCLREIRKRQDPLDKLLCPICRKQTKLEGIDVGDLPHNFTLDALVDELQVHLKLLGTEPSHVTCQSCEEKDQIAVSRCMDCNHFLCQECKKVHSRLAITRYHTIYSLDQFRSGEVVYKSKLREHVPKCQKHLDQSLSIYCTTCEQMTCTTCSVLNHGNHSLLGIPEAYESFKQQVANLVSKVKLKIKEFHNATKAANALHEKLVSTFANTATNISQKALYKYKLELTQKLENIYKERSQIIKTSAAANSHEATQSEQKLEEVSNLMAETNCYEVLDLKQKVLYNLKVLTEKGPIIPPEHLSFFNLEEGGSSVGKLVEEDPTTTTTTTTGALDYQTGRSDLQLPWSRPRDQHSDGGSCTASATCSQVSWGRHWGLVQVDTMTGSYAAAQALPGPPALRPLQIPVRKRQWVLKTELPRNFRNVWDIGVFKNNEIVASDIVFETVSTFFPKHRSERQFEVALHNVCFDGLTVNSSDQILALDDSFVIVYDCKFNYDFKFRPGKGPNINPIGIAVNEDNIIAVSYEDRGRISLHRPDGSFIKMLRARGVGAYLTFYKNRLIYTHSQDITSIDSFTGETVFDVGNGNNDLETGVCCDVDGSIYVATPRYNGEIHHLSPTGEYIGQAIKRCGSARNILITPDGELVVAAEDTLKIYHRV